MSRRDREKEFIDWYYQHYEGKVPEELWEFTKIVWREAWERGREVGRGEGEIPLQAAMKASRELRDIIKKSKSVLQTLK